MWNLDCGELQLRLARPASFWLPFGRWSRRFASWPRRGRVRFRRRLLRHVKIVTLDPGLKSLNSQFWIVTPCSLGHREPPGMPGAGDLASVKKPGREGGSHVWAEIVDGEKIPIHIENTDDSFSHRVALTLAGLDIGSFANQFEFAHAFLQDERAGVSGGRKAFLVICGSP